MVSVMQLGYLGLGVGDVDAWERFATGILGLQSNGRQPDGSLGLRMDEHHHRLILHPGGKDDVAYLGWEVADERALTALTGQLERAGVTAEPGTSAEAETRKVAGLVRFADPSGVPMEAYHGPVVRTEEPFRSPRSISGFKADDQGLGHCVLAVDEFEKSLAFYRDVLGLRVTDFIFLPVAPEVRVKLCFMHCNPRHHSLAFVEMPQPPKRLHHFMLQLLSLDDVGAAWELCRRQEIPLEMDLGRHSNDRMVSFYVRTPSGFSVEYGWGAREVDDATWRVQVHTTGSIWGHRPGG